MMFIQFLYRILVFSIAMVFPAHLIVGQSLVPEVFVAKIESPLAITQERADQPMPPDSVHAQVLGADSAMYISWEAPPDSGLILEGYDIYRLSGFDPEGDPATGIQTWILTSDWPACSDPSWTQLEPGWYAYGVRAVYTNGMISEMAVSNIVGHNMYCNVYVHVTLENGMPADDARAFLFGNDYPYEQYYGQDSIVVQIDSVMRGNYLAGAYQTGFDTAYLDNVSVQNDTMIQIQLLFKKYQVFDLKVDSVSLIATWSKPSMIAVYEDFEGALFPPAGWQLSSADPYGSWFRTLDGSSGGFLIPPGDGYYACDNVDMHGSDPHNSCCDYLITPPLDLTQSEDYRLDFDSYYTGAYGQLAFVEYSYDQGENWEVMWQLNPGNIWNKLSTSLGAFSGQDKEMPLWIAFHADWAGGWASGWAVDNVKIYVPGSQVEFTDFNIMLDDTLISNTTDTTWNYAPLNYGQQYIAAVSVNYPYGISKKDYFSFTSHYLPPPQNLAGSADQSDIILQWDPPVDGTFRNAPDSLFLPENILGYNLYRNNVFLNYQAHSGGYEPQEYVDPDMEPGHYTYYISGIYDLSIYGFPGDSGESMRSGSVTITADYCNELPFSENWSSGTLTQNEWSLEGQGWKIDNGNGNPAPCAVFSPDSTLENYSSFLLSYPFCGDSLSEGNMWLDYEISLLSNQPTGTEFLQVDIWNWDSQGWTKMKEYSNTSGNIQWTSEHVNISQQSLDKIFRIRFTAKGNSSDNIESWFVDNIHVYRLCNGPTNLVSEVNPEQAAIVLNWNAPETIQIDEWIHWDDGVNSGNSIGTGAAVEFDAAARWEPAQLAMYDGASVTEIAFFPAEAQCTYNARVWVGAGAGNMVADQVVPSPIIGQWNYVMLTNPVPVDIAQELWVGYYVNAQTGYPAGVDDGPAIDGYGNMMNFGGWQTLLQISPGQDYNWNIQAHIMMAEGEKIILPGKTGIGSDAAKPRSVTGYNIYRRTEPGEYSLLGFATDTTYTDTDLANEMYCYMVSAVWEGESDQCESEWLGEVCEIMNVGMSEKEAVINNINIFPNPADDRVFITTTGELIQITVYNAQGQLVLDETASGQYYILRSSTFSCGFFLVRVTTTSGEISRFITIQR
jgi:hypothetical protein